MAQGEEAQWKRMRNLGLSVDNLWASYVFGSGEKPCNKMVSSSYEKGIPVLAYDPTTPFPGEFPDIISNFYQRFDFSYKHGASWQEYAFGGLRPILCGSYLADSPMGDPARPSNLGENIGGTWGDLNWTTLFEVDQSAVNVWDKQSKSMKQLTDFSSGKTSYGTKSNEIFFRTSDDFKCPCPYTFRVANGYKYDSEETMIPTTTQGLYTLKMTDLDTFDTGRGVTQAPPVVDCAAKPELPLLGQPFQYCSLWGSHIIPDNTQTINFKPHSAPIAECAPHESPELYENFTYTIASYKDCRASGARDLMLVYTPMFWPSLQEGMPFETVLVITSIIVTIPGYMTPAIRKRWFKMIYDKLYCIWGVPTAEGTMEGFTPTAEAAALLGLDGKSVVQRMTKNGDIFPWIKNPKIKDNNITLHADLDKLICQLNLVGSSVTCNETNSGKLNASAGCLCANGSAVCNTWAKCDYLDMPWDKSCCAAKSCASGGLKVYAYTIELLEKLVSIIPQYKNSEKNISYALSTVGSSGFDIIGVHYDEKATTLPSIVHQACGCEGTPGYPQPPSGCCRPYTFADGYPYWVYYLDDCASQGENTCSECKKSLGKETKCTATEPTWNIQNSTIVVTSDITLQWEAPLCKIAAARLVQFGSSALSYTQASSKCTFKTNDLLGTYINIEWQCDQGRRSVGNNIGHTPMINFHIHGSREASTTLTNKVAIARGYFSSYGVEDNDTMPWAYYCNSVAWNCVAYPPYPGESFICNQGDACNHSEAHILSGKGGCNAEALIYFGETLTKKSYILDAPSEQCDSWQCSESHTETVPNSRPPITYTACDRWESNTCTGDLLLEVNSHEGSSDWPEPYPIATRVTERPTCCIVAFEASAFFSDFTKNQNTGIGEAPELVPGTKYMTNAMGTWGINKDFTMYGSDSLFDKECNCARGTPPRSISKKVKVELSVNFSQPTS